MEAGNPTDSVGEAGRSRGRETARLAGHPPSPLHASSELGGGPSPESLALRGDAQALSPHPAAAESGGGRASGFLLWTPGGPTAGAFMLSGPHPRDSGGPPGPAQTPQDCPPHSSAHYSSAPGDAGDPTGFSPPAGDGKRLESCRRWPASHVGSAAMATAQGKGSSYRDPPPHRGRVATEALGCQGLPGHSCSQASDPSSTWSLALPHPAQHLALSHAPCGPATTLVLAVLTT